MSTGAHGRLRVVRVGHRHVEHPARRRRASTAVGDNAAVPSRPVNSNLPCVDQKSIPPSTPDFGVHADNASPAFFAPDAV